MLPVRWHSAHHWAPSEESEGLFAAVRHDREPPKLHKVGYLLLVPD